MSTTTTDIVALSPERFRVQVTQGATTTSHDVEVSAEMLDRAGLPVADGLAERVVRETFSFLLAREPATAILRSFTLDDVSRYFPEFFDELRRRVRASGSWSA